MIQSQTNKQCGKCGETKSLNEFYKNKRTKSGVHCWCKECFRNDYFLKHDVIRKKQTEYRKINRDKINKQKLKNYKLNKDKYYQKRKEYFNNRLKNDPNFRFNHLLRNRMRIAIKNKYKSGSAVKDLGCSTENARKYIESKFADGMTWNNYGKWHIDHIVPLTKFDLTKREQFIQAVHYTNLQPLWASDNISKGNR